MQKKLIAVAIGGLFAGAAFAQSNVTIYGVADASFENLKASGATTPQTNNNHFSLPSRYRVASNATYFGLKGAEDLGGGMKAVWQIENEVDITGGPNGLGNQRNSTLASRDTYLGLAGNFGTVVAGYLSSLHRSTAAKYDIMPGAAGPGSSMNIIGRVNTGSLYNPRNAQGQTDHTFGNTTIGANNLPNNIGVIARHSAIAYLTPNFSGFSAGLAYVANETKDTTPPVANYHSRDPKAWNLALHYDQGPLSVSYSYLDIKDFGSGIPTGAWATVDISGAEKHKAHLLGAKYTFGATTLSLMWDQVKSTISDGPGTFTGDITNKRSNWYLGVKHTMGAHNLYFAYAKAGKNHWSVGNRGLCTNSDCNGASGADMYSIRYGYDFSKRTQMYAQWSKTRNQANASYDFNVGSVASPAGNGRIGAGSDPQVLAVGVRHTF